MSNHFLGAPECSRGAHLLGRLVMKLAGWRVVGEVPPVSKMIIVAAPHTSNWDLIYLLGAAFTLHLRVNWLGKDSLFRTPLGPLLRFVGGIPVDRSRANNMVGAIVQEIRQGSGCAIVIPPAGTRSRTEYWKSGFYWIAVGAEIPLVCGFLDYAKKEAGLGLSFVPSGEVTADMDRLRAFYRDITARFPDQKSRILLRQEESGESGIQLSKP
ncbi:MAG: lysophospholipid acyltransferase family protein [Proteobacteria bacterium]|nr:lysophospholipid acyltransferase family protein [Pseudomonadota bacterium]